MKGMRSRVNPKKKAFANYLRQNQTWPEKKLGHEMKEKFPGIPIYKQSVAYGYILDFYVTANFEGAPYKGLAIEVDGPCHASKMAYDANRDRVLWARGIRTLRFDLGSLKNNLPAVIAIICNEIQKIRK